MQPRLVNGEVRLLAVLTKADKLNRSQSQLALLAAQEVLAEVTTEASDISVTLFSALSRQGLGDVAETVYGWTHGGPQAQPEAEGAGAEGPVDGPAVAEPGSAQAAVADDPPAGDSSRV
jgi:GTP-binding protein